MIKCADADWSSKFKKISNFKDWIENLYKLKKLLKKIQICKYFWKKEVIFIWVSLSYDVIFTL